MQEVGNPATLDSFVPKASVVGCRAWVTLACDLPGNLFAFKRSASGLLSHGRSLLTRSRILIVVGVP